MFLWFRSSLSLASWCSSIHTRDLWFERLLLHRCTCRFLHGIYTSYRPFSKGVYKQAGEDGYRIFNAHPFRFYFICHSVISLVGSKYMSPDDYKRANKRPYVSITKFKDYELKNELVSEFESNTDMYGAPCASSQIQFLNCLIFLHLQEE